MIEQLLVGLTAMALALVFLVGAGYVALWFIKALDRIFS